MIAQRPEPMHARRDEEAVRLFAAGLDAMRRGAIAAGRALLRIDRCGHFIYEGCASIGEFGERHGTSAWEARRLVSLAKALEAAPPLEERVLAGRVPLDSAARLDAVLSNPSYLRAGDDWLGWAERESARALKRRVERRVEEVRIGEAPAVALTVYMSPRGREDLARARCIASRKADRLLTDGETVEVAVDLYLDTFDFRRTRGRSRRLPHTTTVRGRYVPAEVRRELIERDGDCCALPFCDHDVFLENAHVVPHANGGHRDLENLLRLCSKHHRMFDEGKLRLVGPPDQPTFVDDAGRPLDGRQPATVPPTVPTVPTVPTALKVREEPAAPT